MEKLITIINPLGATSFKGASKSKTKKGQYIMARRKKRSRASYVKAARKAARTRARSRGRRKNPARKLTRHRPVSYTFGRGKNKKHIRSPYGYRLGPRRINRRKRVTRRRKNPNFRAMSRNYFGKNRMFNALAILGGLGGAAILKGIVVKALPSPMVGKFYGVAAVILGATINMKARKKEIKAVGTGMVVFGIYDALVSNIPSLGAYLPSIGAPMLAPSETQSGSMNYGRSTYGASIGSPGSQLEIVGANYSHGVNAEIVGESMDLADAMEMSA